jgi:hypothetical protein
VKANQATNYTAPKTSCDNLLLGEYVFDLGKIYGGGTRSPELGKVLAQLGIGTGRPSSGDPIIPNAGDPAWLSYRLKGSQTEFTGPTGTRTRLGNSVTEGGFVNSSSCITCHARASIAAKGSIPPALSVFMSRASETGYLESANGTPNPSWYADSRQPAVPIAQQTDFVWGFLAASCIANQPTEGCPAQTAPQGLRVGAASAARPLSIRERIRLGQ